MDSPGQTVRVSAVVRAADSPALGEIEHRGRNRRSNNSPALQTEDEAANDSTDAAVDPFFELPSFLDLDNDPTLQSVLPHVFGTSILLVLATLLVVVVGLLLFYYLLNHGLANITAPLLWIMMSGFVGTILWFMIISVLRTAQHFALHGHHMCSGSMSLERILLCCLGLTSIVILLGIFLAVFWIVGADGNGEYHAVFFRPWNPHRLPGLPLECQSRVQPEQSVLFSHEIYNVTFYRFFPVPPDPSTPNSTESSPWTWTAYNETRFLEIRHNDTLCGQGFEGDQDIYGLGIRWGLYLQWITALLTNNLLPDLRQELRSVYLIFAFSISVATYVVSFTQSCIFGIEIEILYWLYWGGYICVYASSPSQTRLGSRESWVGLGWTTVIHSVMHVLMVLHGAWFIYYAYDSFFPRMPCGTVHFFFAKLLDPSLAYNRSRELLMLLTQPFFLAFFFFVPSMTLLAASEISQSIKDSYAYNLVRDAHSLGLLMPAYQATNNDVDHSSSSNMSSRLRLVWNSILHILVAMLRKTSGACGEARTFVESSNHLQFALGLVCWPLKTFGRRSRSGYRRLRASVGLGEDAQKGIRLLTPVDIRRRNHYKLRCFLVWVVAFASTVTAIETTLAWNGIREVYNAGSVGQCASLTIGAAGLLTVLFRLLQNEMKRRWDKKQGKPTGNAVELDELPNTLSGAFQHALAQADAAFLTNDGILPAPVGQQKSWFTSRSSLETVDLEPYTMSGGLGISETSQGATQGEALRASDESSAGAVYTMSGALP